MGRLKSPLRKARRRASVPSLLIRAGQPAVANDIGARMAAIFRVPAMVILTQRAE
jgi:hypothetical protein